MNIGCSILNDTLKQLAIISVAGYAAANPQPHERDVDAISNGDAGRLDSGADKRMDVPHIESYRYELCTFILVWLQHRSLIHS